MELVNFVLLSDGLSSRSTRKFRTKSKDRDSQKKTGRNLVNATFTTENGSPDNVSTMEKGFENA